MAAAFAHTARTAPGPPGARMVHHFFVAAGTEFVVTGMEFVADLTAFVAAGTAFVTDETEFVATGMEFVADKRTEFVAASSRARAAGPPSTMTFGVAEGIAVPGVQRS